MNESIVLLFYIFHYISFNQRRWVIHFFNDLFSDSHWLIFNSWLLNNVIWLLILILVLSGLRKYVLNILLLNRLCLLYAFDSFCIFLFKFFFGCLCSMSIYHITFTTFLFCLKRLSLISSFCYKLVFILNFL